ncbi:putative myophilin [Penaeus vannamei]|uniref:Putative myophilin n=1 Tax=Penaeus vannamei TaxID=6689 RepID=A0A423TDU0_PENVA|nr:putative myophilin [Penaeus vannamei]
MSERERRCSLAVASVHARESATSREKEALDWIFNVLGEPRPEGDIGDILRDGQVLCRLMNKLAPGAIPKINASGSQFKMMENINKAHPLPLAPRFTLTRQFHANAQNKRHIKGKLAGEGGEKRAQGGPTRTLTAQANIHTNTTERHTRHTHEASRAEAGHQPHRPPTTHTPHTTHIHIHNTYNTPPRDGDRPTVTHTVRRQAHETMIETTATDQRHPTAGNTEHTQRRAEERTRA